MLPVASLTARRLGNGSGQSTPPHTTAPSQQQQQPEADQNTAAEVDRQLSAVWEELKGQMRTELDPESAKFLDSLSYEELTGPNAMQLFRRLAGT
jgi:hypothetical protein